MGVVSSEKGLEQFEYLIHSQKDDIPEVSEETLLDSFLQTCTRIGIITDEISQDIETPEHDTDYDDRDEYEY